MKPIEKIDE